MVGLAWTRTIKNLVSEYIMYLHLMGHFEGMYPGTVTHVSFEQLAANPEEVCSVVNTVLF